MEHGLHMLQDQGAYLPGCDRHQRCNDDFIWMEPCVPQQLYRTGWQEAAYPLGKDISRSVRFGRPNISV